MNFDDCFEKVVGHEGGYTADRMDRGNWTGGEVGKGELKGTKFGISAAAYPTLNIAALTVEEAKDIYLRDYWLKMRLDDMPNPIRYELFDFAVNSGVGAAAEALQGAVGALRDGSVGPKTIAAVQKADLAELQRHLFVERAMVFALSPNDRYYGRGWYARLYDVTMKAWKEAA